MKKYKMILFDLDGTLLPMDQDVFVRNYFGRLAVKLAPMGYDPKALVNHIWAGVGAMVKNDGSCTNEDAFWKEFSAIYGPQVMEHIPVFDEFYRNEFQLSQEACGFNPKAKETVHGLKEMGYRVALATNPIFPSVATESRIRWAGLEPEEFELYTTYENFSYCKPNPAYYSDIIRELSLDSAACLMVGRYYYERLAVFCRPAEHFAHGAVEIEGLFIDYQASTVLPQGITLGGSTAMVNAKIHENTDGVDAIQLKNGYTSENVPNDNYIKLSVEGGFKAGDKVTIAGFFNNSDDTKKSAADLYVLDAAAENGYKVLFTTQQFINGRTQAGDPVAESYVLAEDAEALYVGRNGNTGTNICLLQVERGEGGGSDPVNPDPVVPEGPAYGSGVLVTFTEFSAGANPLSWSKDGLVLKATDEDGKMSCDANSQYFGEAGNYLNLTTRLKSSGKSSAKLGFTITVPAAGKLFLFMRTGSNSATRTVTVGGVATASLSVGEANVTTGTVVAADGTVTEDKSIYTPYELDATSAGDVTLEFDGSINIYGLEFRAN